MKRVLLLLIVITNSIFAQNIDEQKVSFQYEQKPLYSLDRSIPYRVTIGYMEYSQKSQDSLVRYVLSFTRLFRITLFKFINEI